jgi:hypothetical protein
MNSYPSFDFISISSNDFIEVQIATVFDFLDFTSKLKGERGVALSQHIMFNFKHIYSGGTRQDKLTPHRLL